MRAFWVGAVKASDTVRFHLEWAAYWVLKYRFGYFFGRTVSFIDFPTLNLSVVFAGI